MELRGLLRWIMGLGFWLIILYHFTHLKVIYNVQLFWEEAVGPAVRVHVRVQSLGFSARVQS